MEVGGMGHGGQVSEGWDADWGPVMVGDVTENQKEKGRIAYRTSVIEQYSKRVRRDFEKIGFEEFMKKYPLER